MTDEQIDALESEIIALEPCHRKWNILDIIAELRQMREERNWLIKQISDKDCCNKNKLCIPFSKSACENCWLKAAKEATCQKN